MSEPITPDTASDTATHMATDEGEATLAAFRETWPAFQREDINTRRLDTDTVRRGWPKPTIYREHETIHVLLNLIDHLRREADQPTRPAQRPVGWWGFAVSRMRARLLPASGVRMRWRLRYGARLSRRAVGRWTVEAANLAARPRLIRLPVGVADAVEDHRDALRKVRLNTRDPQTLLAAVDSEQAMEQTLTGAPVMGDLWGADDTFDTAAYQTYWAAMEPFTESVYRTAGQAVALVARLER